MRSQWKSRYEIANDRLKRIGTNKKVGLSGGIPIYVPAALEGSFVNRRTLMMILVDTDSSNISQSKVVGISLINASVDTKVQYTEKLERVVDTTTDSSIKNNFGELSSSSKKALEMYYKDPSIGERYVHNTDSQNKNIFIIRKVDSVIHTYELLDKNGGWIPLSKSDFQNNFTKYKG